MQEPSFEAFNSSDVNLDGFDFNLEGLADSKNSETSAMDLQFDSMKEELTSSLNDLKFDDATLSDDELEPTKRPQPTARTSPRHRRSLLSKSKQFKLVNSIDFDPPAASQERHHMDDVSINSYATAQTHHISNGNPSSTSLCSMGQSPVFTLDSYNEALEHLAQTMKRTEESRKQVMLQRAIIAQQEEKQRQSEEQARQYAEQAVAFRRASAMRSNFIQPTYGTNTMSNGTSSFSGATSFLTGSGGTLTSGLAQSRRQLQMYMAHMNGQTF